MFSCTHTLSLSLSLTHTHPHTLTGKFYCIEEVLPAFERVPRSPVMSALLAAFMEQVP
jgi:hypothetical protein